MSTDLIEVMKTQMNTTASRRATLTLALVAVAPAASADLLCGGLFEPGLSLVQKDATGIYETVEGGDIVRLADRLGTVERFLGTAKDDGDASIACPDGGTATRSANERNGFDYTLFDCTLSATTMNGTFSSFGVPGSVSGVDDVNVEMTDDFGVGAVRIFQNASIETSFTVSPLDVDPSTRKRVSIKRLTASAGTVQSTVTDFTATIIWDQEKGGRTRMNPAFDYSSGESGNTYSVRSGTGVLVDSARGSLILGQLQIDERVTTTALDLPSAILGAADSLICESPSAERLFYNVL